MFKPTEEKQVHGGVQKIYRFNNGYGASVVSHRFSYGGPEGQWEVAVLDRDDRLCYDTPVTHDVIGRLDWDEVEGILKQIDELSERAADPAAFVHPETKPN